MAGSDRKRSGRSRTGHYQVTGPHEMPNGQLIPPPHVHPQSQLYLSEPRQTGLSAGSELQHVPSSSMAEYEDHFVTEHEIKFTRHEVCSPSTCICFFVALLFTCTAILSGIYYGQRVFKAQFVVHNQEFLSPYLENSESNEFRTLSNSLRQKIDSLFKESSIGHWYIKSEIVAFERKRNSATDVLIHFNVHVSGSKSNVEASDIYMVLAEEIVNNKLRVFDTLMIDHNSIDVQERRWMPREKAALLVNPWTYRSFFPGMLEGLSTEPTPGPRKCVPLGLQYCRFVSYNLTSYPNFFHHWNLSSVEDEFILYKELIDSECYHLAKEFLCNLLQPQCVNDEMILPCRSYCEEFYSSCRKWLPDKLLNGITCHNFPVNNNSRCREKPNCATGLRLQSQSGKLCDGVRDCADGSDEASCPYCPWSTDYFHCGNRQCVPRSATCDGTKDCRNGADEINCLALLSLADTKQIASNHHEGYLRATSKGKHSFVCSEQPSSVAQNYSLVYYNNQLQILGVNICNENHFEELVQITSKHSTWDGFFTKFVPGTTLISPYSVQCKNRDIYYVECAIPKCGLSSAPLDSWPDSGTHQAWPGYWPWFAKINLNGNYLCDGTLISIDTVLVHSACFCNHHRFNINSEHNLTVTLGSVRYSVDNYEAKTFAVTHLDTHSDTKISLLKLATIVNASHYIRPACQNKEHLVMNQYSLRCVVLSVNFEQDQLQYRTAQVVSLERCQQQYNLSWTVSEKEQQSRNKLCIELNDNEGSDYGTAGQLAAGACPITSSRHLYCQTKHHWNLLALEQPLVPVPSKSSSTLKTLLLFHIIHKVSL